MIMWEDNAKSKTLIYAGCGWDEHLVTVIEKFLPYKKIIAYDALPKYPHYRPGQLGWCDTHTAKRFFAALEREYGEYVTRSDTELYFPKLNLTYHHSVKCEDIIVPKGDVYICGYLPPKTWLAAMCNRRVYLNCDTLVRQELREADIPFKLVHDEDFCFCGSSSSQRCKRPLLGKGIAKRHPQASSSSCKKRDSKKKKKKKGSRQD